MRDSGIVLNGNRECKKNVKINVNIYRREPCPTL
jgi:hypothetical protein